MPPQLADAEGGVIVSALAAVTVIVAVTVVPVLSVIVYFTVVAAVPGGTVTENVPPLAVTVAGVGANIGLVLSATML